MSFKCYKNIKIKNANPQGRTLLCQRFDITTALLIYVQGESLERLVCAGKEQRRSLTELSSMCCGACSPEPDTAAAAAAASQPLHPRMSSARPEEHSGTNRQLDDPGFPNRDNPASSQ